MSNENREPAGSTKTKKKNETSEENDDIEDDDIQHSGDETGKGNNNNNNNNDNNDIIGATEGNRRFRRSNTNSNDRFKEVDYKFDLIKADDVEDSKSGDVPAVEFNGILYSSFKELKTGLLSGMFGKGEESKHVFETLVAALGTVSDEGTKSRNSSRRGAVVDDDDNYQERRLSADARRQHPFGISMVSLIIF